MNPNPHCYSDEGGWGTERVPVKIRETGQAWARNITVRYAGYQKAGKKDGGYKQTVKALAKVGKTYEGSIERGD